MTRLGARARWLVLGLFGLLTACGNDEVAFVLTCPQVLIVQEASQLTQYVPGAGRDMLDVRFDAEIGQVNWVCQFFVEENRVEIEVRFAMLALRGPAADSDVARFPYFVAVADPQGTILAKQVFAIDIQFPGNSLEIGHLERVFQTLEYASLSNAANYTVYIGFQLTPEQLADVRSRK
jgi:hypothetical protein